jgi:hypothetical protein
MAQYVPLPDGNSVKVREGETPEQAYERAQSMYPDSFGVRKEPEKPKQDTTGLKAAASASATRLGGEFELLKGKLGFKDEAEAQKEYEAAQAKAAARFTPTEEGWTEAPFQKFKETLGGSLPYMVAPAAAGLAALAAPVSAPVAAGLGLLGAGAVSTGQFTGSNLARQMDTGKSLEETSLGAAAAAAVPQALIDTAAMALLPGVGKLFGSVGSKLTTEQAKAIATQTLGKAAMDYTAKTGAAMGREGLTEVAQQTLERLQAGLEIADPEARKEYIESFIGGAVLGGTLAPVGRAFERSSAKTQAAKAEREERNIAQAAAAEQERIAAEKEAAEKQTPDYALKVANQLKTLEQEKLSLQQQIRKISKDSSTEAEDKAFNKVINNQLRINEAARSELAPEVNRLKQAGIYDQALEQQRVAGLSPMDYLLERTKTVQDRAVTPVEDTAYEESGLAFADPLVPSVERRKAQEAERARVANIPMSYAAERMELARTQTYDPTGQDFVEYLLQDPYKAGLVVETRTPLPGLSSSESTLIRNAVAKRLKDMGKEELATRQAELKEQKIGKAPADPMAAFMEQSEALDTDRRQGVTDSDIAFTERQAAMPREVIQQGDLFGEQRVGQAAGVTDRRNVGQQLADLQRQLEIAYAQRNVRGGAQYRETIRSLTEQIRDLQDRASESTIGELGQETAGIQSQLGQFPASLEAKREAEAARQAALTKVANKEEGSQEAVAASIVDEIRSARPDLRPETLTEIEQDVRNELGTLARYGATPEVLTYTNARLDAISQKWRGGTERGETATKVATPKTTSADMLREQMDRAFAQNDQSTRTERRERYAPEDMAVLNQIANNFNVFAANPDRLNMAGEWLNRLTTTGRSSPEMTRDLQNELARLEEGKLQESGQQELPGRFMPKAVAPQSETRVGKGKAQFVSPEDVGPLQGSPAERYAPAKKSTAFATASEFQKYLASDALKIMRQAMGIGKDTASRTHARIQLFRKKVENISKQLAAFEERKKDLQTKRGADANIAKDLLATAEANLKKIYERLDAELADLQADYMQARQQFDFTAQTVEDIGQKIADNLAAFQSVDTAAVEAAQKTAEAKTAYATAIEQPVSKRTFSALRKARREVITAIEQQITASRKAGADETLLAFLNADLNLQLQLLAEEKTLDQDAQALFDAGMALEYASAAQKRSRKNKKELEQAQQELAAALELKGSVATEMASTDAQIAAVERDIAAAEKQLAQAGQALQPKQPKQEDTFATALAAIKIEPLSKAERDAQTAADKKKLEEFQASTAALAALPGERIDFSQRQQMLELLRVSDKDSDRIDASIKEIEAGIEEMQIQVAVAEEQLVDEKTPDRIAALNKKVADGNERVAALQKSLGNYEKAKARKLVQENRARVLLSGDPEVTQDLDKRIDKLTTNIKNQEELEKQTVSPKTGKPIPEETKKDRAKTLARYKRELQVLTGVRSNRLGIKRIDVTTGAATKDLRTDKKTGQTTVKGKRVSREQQEQMDAELERVQAYGTAKDRLSAMEGQLAAMQAAKEPRGKAKKEERAEKIRDLQEKVNKQQAEVDRLAPKTVGAVSQATRVQSAAPGKLRAGTAETKADAGVTKQPIVEKRTVAQPTAEQAVADANAFAERLLAAKTPTDLADDFADQDLKTRAAILAAVDSNVSMYRNQIATLENERDALQASVDLAKDPLRIPVVTRDRLATIREELGIKQRLLAKAEGTKLQTEMMEYASLRAPNVEGSTGVSGFDMGVSDAIEDFEFSRGVPVQGLTTTELRNELRRAVGDEDTYAKKVSVYNSVADFLQANPKYAGQIPSDAKAFVDPNTARAYMFADNIAKGEGLAILLHEVGVHIGFRNFFNAGQFKALANAVRSWSKAPANTMEGKIGRAAEKRVREAGTPANQVDDELIAYAVEEAVKAGVTPAGVKSGSAVQNWLRMIVDAFTKALEKFGIAPESVKVGDLVNMAYGAAQLELKGTWHGTAGTFTEFDHTYMSSGEGSQAFGWGTYRAERESIAQYYKRVAEKKNSGRTIDVVNAWYDLPEIKKWNAAGYNMPVYKGLNFDEAVAKWKKNKKANADVGTAIGLLENYHLEPYYKTEAEFRKAMEDLLDIARDNARSAIKFAPTPAIKKIHQQNLLQIELLDAKDFDYRSDLPPTLLPDPPKGRLLRTLHGQPEEAFINLDAPILDQSARVGDALRKVFESLTNGQKARFNRELSGDPNPSGKDVYDAFKLAMGNQKVVSDLMASFGIAGNKFLDRPSRNQPVSDKSRYNYVDFLDKDQGAAIIASDINPIGPASGLLFSRGAPADALEALSKKIIAQPKPLREKLGNNLALQTEMQAVDMRAGLRETLKFGDDKLFTQAMYHVRKAEQKMAQMFTVMNSGPLVAYKDDKGFVGYRSSNKNSAREVFDAIADIPVDDPQMKTDLAQTYLVAVRANNKGLPKLDLGAMKLEQAELDAALAAANANPALKAALENVRRKYSAYNKGMIEFLAESGRISKKMAADLLKEGDYVPFYRVDENGKADLVFNNNVTFNVGDIRRQPYLAELKGGDTKLLPLNEAIQRNTLLLTDMALTNNATKSVAYGLQALGKGMGPVDPVTGKPTNLMTIKPGKGPDDARVIRFYQEPDPNKPDDKGERYLIVNTKGTAAEGIPAELVVQSLEGASLALPGFLKLGGVAADWLRAGVTRTPLYIARKLIREPMAAAFTGGLNSNTFSAIFKAGAEFVRMSRGTSDAQAKLIEKGLIQSNIFAGDMSDMKKMALQLASGKDQSAFDKVLAAADRYAMRADAATLALVLKNAQENGLSEVEADMMTMESMNFYKRGLSPTLQYAARLIPFFNAQIQGLNVLVKAARGNMPFEEQQQIKRKFYNNAMLLMATGLVYAMAMEDDEYFRNARPRDKYSNFFLPIPGVDEPLKMPIPFEAGYFYSLAVAAVDAMRAETDGKAQWQALRDLFLGSIPGYSSMGVPQIAKPIAEVWTNKNFLTGGEVESRRLQGLSTEERYLATTTELAKQMSKAVPILSPIQIEHIVRGYFGVLPLAAVATANGLFERGDKGEKPAGRASDLPLIGTAFQKKYGGADADVVYREAQEAMEARTTLNKMISEGRREEAIEYRDAHRAELAMAPMAGQYRQVVGRINADIRRTQERNDLTAEEKRIRLDMLDKAKQDRANAFIRQSRLVEERVAGGKT